MGLSDIYREIYVFCCQLLSSAAHMQRNCARKLIPYHAPVTPTNAIFLDDLDRGVQTKAQGQGQGW